MLSAKVCLITGATRGIGWEIAKIFSANNAVCLINGHSNESLLHDRVQSLREGSGKAEAFFGNAADPEWIKATYQRIFKEHGRLDVLVNNAGILEDNFLGMISEESLRKVFEINTFGPIRNVQAASKLMVRSGGGSIINMSSIIGRFGNEGQVVYGASKAAVIGMTYSAAKELAPKKIRVNAVAPGFIDTDMVRSLPSEKFDQRVKSIKMGRIGSPKEVANTVLFLASDDSSYLTGQVLGVDGGMLI